VATRVPAAATIGDRNRGMNQSSMLIKMISASKASPVNEEKL
jgi:hypothetical protein